MDSAEAAGRGLVLQVVTDYSFAISVLAHFQLLVLTGRSICFAAIILTFCF